MHFIYKKFKPLVGLTQGNLIRRPRSIQRLHFPISEPLSLSRHVCVCVCCLLLCVVWFMLAEEEKRGSYAHVLQHTHADFDLGNAERGQQQQQLLCRLGLSSKRGSDFSLEVVFYAARAPWLVVAAASNPSLSSSLAQSPSNSRMSGNVCVYGAHSRKQGDEKIFIDRQDLVHPRGKRDIGGELAT